MSEIAGQTGVRGAATAVVNESYSFACMRCGHGWEQSYEIEHHVDTDGHQFVMYVAEGQVVPSPLSRPACLNCDGHVVRIMRAGQVSSVREAAQRQYQAPRSRPAAATEAAATAAEDAVGDDGAAVTPLAEHKDHHWHLSDLLHPFHRKAS
jgi:Zn finger protein HypA/HybF involved in hydrogenase expression